MSDMQYSPWYKMNISHQRTPITNACQMNLGQYFLVLTIMKKRTHVQVEGCEGLNKSLAI